mmetsp:Transcript_19977/g.37688  ORF Transcript_19977/g.37688 Transcript_19977/m.37688 type:complete len:560 (-) Transcript_19977:72-1751(-)
MATSPRPGTKDTERTGRSSPGFSQGAATVAQSESQVNPERLAEEVAEDITSSMFDKVLSHDLVPSRDGRVDEEAREQIATLRLQNEQLQAELASAKSEMEFATLKEAELENRHNVAQRTIDDLTRQVDSLVQQTRSLSSDHQVTKNELNLRTSEKTQLEERLASSQRELTTSESVLGSVRAELEQARSLPNMEAAGGEQGPSQREQSLQNACAGLQERVAALESDLISAQSELALRKDVSTTQPTVELGADSSEEKPLLAAAYQQISVLNTQLAHLYTELTMARTEVQRLRVNESQNAAGQNPANDNEAEVMKQSQQIADLVSDIRHLQLDLEYHQQKLDQMIEEKQQMMRDLKKAQVDLEESKRQVEERDQMLKHREVDLQQMKSEMKSPRGGQGSEGEGDGTLAALRAEAAAKDSALIVSHYELHKEKLLRDRLEQKNLKLMDRMQKLMMVVETMRKENVTLERNLVAKEQHCETKEMQLRQVTHKAKQLQKLAKGKVAGQKGGKSSGATVLELESPQQGLPPLDRSQRSIDSSGGRRSGMSTPRTPRAPPSPYGSR